MRIMPRVLDKHLCSPLVVIGAEEGTTSAGFLPIMDEISEIMCGTPWTTHAYADIETLIRGAPLRHAEPKIC
jgi:hypothetical protein